MRLTRPTPTRGVAPQPGERAILGTAEGNDLVLSGVIGLNINSGPISHLLVSSDPGLSDQERERYTLVDRLYTRPDASPQHGGSKCSTSSGCLSSVRRTEPRSLRLASCFSRVQAVIWLVAESRAILGADGQPMKPR